VRIAAPRATPQHFGFAHWRSCRVLRRTCLVKVIVIPVADPFPDIPGHVIDAIGNFAGLQRPHRHQRPHGCSTSFSHSSRGAASEDRCPTNRCGHPSPVPPSPIPPPSAGACRPICSTRPHPPNPHWRPGASGTRVGWSGREFFREIVTLKNRTGRSGIPPRCFLGQLY
jgi:hypothetical protein